jgi:hypothetical protein
MSLTSILEQGFKTILVDKIPVPKDKFIPSDSPVVYPKTKNHGLIGTAFDYLLRSKLKRINPQATEYRFIADASIELVRKAISRDGFFQARNTKIGEMELHYMEDIATKYREERSKFLATGVLEDSFLELTIKFARMDNIFRAGFYDNVTKPVDPLDIEDMRALYNLIPNELKSAKNVLLDPTFGEISKMVGGADVDLILDNTMIDIKTTKEMKLDGYIWSQIVGYLMLADEAYKRYYNFPKIEHIGFYFSRYGKLWTIDADYVRKNPNYEEMKSELFRWGRELKEN